MLLGKLSFQGSYAISYRHGDLAAAQILVGQGNAGDVDILNHALGKGLQQHFAAIVRGVLIVCMLAGHTAQLAASGHEDELGAAWEFLLHGMRHFRHGKVRGDESHDQSCSFCQVAEFLQFGAGELIPIEVDSFDILLAAGSGHRHGRGGMHPLSGSRGWCRSGFRGRVFLVFGEKTKHCANTSFIPG